MPDLLLEVGCEELPASFVRKAFTDLQENIVKALGAAGVPHGQSQSLGTPRRLIVHVEGLAERQPDVSKEMRGPSIAAAYDAEGNPTKALEGFCRGQGADPSQVRRDGEYVWVDKVVEGKATAEILATLLPEAIKGLNFEKAMRWGSSRMRFARPIRWLLASLGGEVVPFEIEGVASDLKSRGHRFYAPEEFTARTFDELIDGLIARKVEPDPAERETRIREGATINCSGQPDLTDALVQENVYLTEWPLAIEGSFKPEFLDLPESVLVIAMAKHEKFFPVRDDAARLTNKFISIRNAGEDETVRNGNAWVLNARFNDAKFFFDEDARLKLSDFLEKTSGIVFQEKLGTVRQRADRLAELSAEVMRMTGADEHEIGSAREAGRYAKADLSTGLVGELPALQGLIGGEYAKREGLPEEVCCGIASHYELPRNQRPSSAGQRIGIAVLIADQLDKLAGYLGLGLVPSGSSDPYGLRRAATHVIEAVWHWRDGSIKPFQIFLKAIRLYENAGIKLNEPEGASKDEDLSAAESAALRSLAEIFRSRYEALTVGVRHDILEAALLPDASSMLDPRGVRMRTKILGMADPDTDFVQTATRPLNILAAAERKGIPFASRDPLRSLEVENLQSDEALHLLERLRASEDPLFTACRAEDAQGVLEALLALKEPINTFFDSTMVMAEDPDVRYARLTLLAAAREQILVAGDFSKIVVEGD